jgi:hypothetical protein
MTGNVHQGDNWIFQLPRTEDILIENNQCWLDNYVLILAVN